MKTCPPSYSKIIDNENIDEEKQLKINEFKSNRKIVDGCSINAITKLIHDIEYTVVHESEKKDMIQLLFEQYIPTINSMTHKLVSGGKFEFVEKNLNIILKTTKKYEQIPKILIKNASNTLLKCLLKQKSVIKNKNLTNEITNSLLERENVVGFLELLDSYGYIYPMLSLIRKKFPDLKLTKEYIEIQVYPQIHNKDLKIVRIALEIILIAINYSIFSVEPHVEELSEIFMKRCKLDEIGILLVKILGIHFVEHASSAFIIDPVMFASHYDKLDFTFSMIKELLKAITNYKFTDSAFNEQNKFLDIEKNHVERFKNEISSSLENLASSLEKRNSSSLENRNSSCLENSNSSCLENRNSSSLENIASSLENRNSSSLENRNSLPLENRNSSRIHKNSRILLTDEENLFKPNVRKLIDIIANYEYEEDQISEIIHFIFDTLSNESLKYRNKIILIRILNCFQGDKQFFYKICELIANERRIEVVIELIGILKKSKYTHLIEKMTKNLKLKKLLLRIYPLYMKDKNFYKEIVNEFRYLPETEILIDYYGIKGVFY